MKSSTEELNTISTYSFYQQFATLFFRTFDCLRVGAQGVRIVRPEEGYPIRPGDVDIDQGDDDEIEDYDENVVRNNNPQKTPAKESEEDEEEEDDDDDDDDDDEDSDERK